MVMGMKLKEWYWEEKWKNDNRKGKKNNGRKEKMQKMVMGRKKKDW